MKNFREKSKNIRERLKNAQHLSDPSLMREIQTETLQLYKVMMLKQMLPSCIRLILFFVFFGIFDSLVFFNYREGLLPFQIPLFGDGWWALFFLFTIGIILLKYGSKKAYYKVTGKVDNKGSMLKDLLSEISKPSPSVYSSKIDSGTSVMDVSSDEITDNSSPDSWKDRLEK